MKISTGGSLLQANKIEVLACICLAIALTALSLVPSLTVGVVLDRVVQTQAYATLGAVLLALLLLWICEIVFLYIQDRLLFYVTTSTIGYAESDFLQALEAASFKSTENFNDQHGAVRFSSIAADIRFQADWLISSISVPFCVLISFSVIFFVSFPLFWPLLIVTVFYTILHGYTNSSLRKTYSAAKELSDAEAKINREIFSGILTLKIFSAFAHYLFQWSSVKNSFHHILAKNSTIAVIQGILSLTYERLALAIILGVGAYEALDGRMSVGQLVMANMLFRQVAIQVRKVSPLLQRRVAFLVSCEARDSFLKNLSSPSDFCKWKAIGSNCLIQLTNAGFHDDAGRAILSAVTFDVARKGVLAIVGESGSGKSTLLKLLAGVYSPSVGVCKFNLNINEEPRISFMSQAEYIFSGTIGDNVLLGRPGYRFNINELLEKLHLGKLQFQGATRLSDVAVKDAGHEFSGGERQRILFARAIWASADLYLFDEPTTGLDPVAKSAVIDEIRNLAQRSPVVFVTHDPDLLEIAGEVLFMNRGRVSEHGDAMSLISDKRSCTSQMFAGGLKNVARGCPDTETSQAAEVLS